MRQFFLRRHFFACIFCAFISLFFFACSDSDSSSGSDSGDAPVVKTSDWLFVLYFDADNDLNDTEWINMVESEYALASLQKDAAAGKSVPSMRIVVLWDGADKNKNEETKEKYADITRLHPDGAIFELGPSDGTDHKSDENWYLSSNTIDLTSTAADWLPKEPNMNDASTLANFLSWTKKRYTAKNIVFGLSNHGCGTDYEAISGGAARSACADDDTTSGTGMLTTADLKQAFNASGFRPHVIWMDACLQASCEIAYDLRGYADSLVSSASISLSNNYETILSCIAKDSTYEYFPCYVVSCYRYHKITISPRKEVVEQEPRASSFRTMSQVGIDLNVVKQEALYAAVENLASSLLTNDRNKLKAIYDNYLFQDPRDESKCKGWVYGGTFSYLSDLGYFCYQLTNDETLANVGISDASVNAAVKLDEALGSVVLSAWVGKRAFGENEKALYRVYVHWTDDVPEAVEFGEDSTDPNKKNWMFGPTIAIKGFEPRIDTEYNTVTGYSKKWGELLKIWHSSN